MKKVFIASALAVLSLTPGMAQKVNKSSGGYPITPVPFTSVKVWNNTFWGQRIETSRKVTIPLAFSKCESEGRYKNFERAAHPSDKYDVSKLMPLSFDDTDPYKTIEGASYVLQTYPDKKLADVAALTGDTAYIHAIDRIWENIVSKKLYITGGIGATNNGEAFGPNYYLPNMSAYCETCAAIGNVYVNYRLFLLHGERANIMMYWSAPSTMVSSVA